MKLALSAKALRDYQKLQKKLQRTADKQFSLLLDNLTHPSLRAKKFDAPRDIWQARLTKGYRFYFQIRGEIYFIVTISKHPK